MVGGKAMIDHDEAVAKAVGILAANFGRENDAMLLEAYSVGLSELTRQQIEQATAVAIRKCKFFPTCSELIEFARTSGVSYESQALIAWEQLQHALHQDKPSLMPPLVAAIARQLGGFNLLAEMPLTEFANWKRKEFLAAYVALSKENPERIAALAGPTSDIGAALAGGMKRLPSREDNEKTMEKNRRTLQNLVNP